MEKPYLLHMFTPAKNLSPFDVNMAYDAGWDHLIPYLSVETEEVTGLVQDAIFSRGPKAVRRTGVFIGGRDIHLATDMLETARSAMVPPFEVSVFADPSGAFTTGAAIVAKVEAALESYHGDKLEGQHVLVFGGTGPVGSTAAVLAAQNGARVTLAGHAGVEAPRTVAERCREYYGVSLEAVDGSSPERKAEILKQADVVVAAAAAGVQVLDGPLLEQAQGLKVAADVNAVPPPGIAGLNAQDDGEPLEGPPKGSVGIGALAVGGLKYLIQHELLKRMREADGPQYLGFVEALEIGREHVGKS